MLSKAPVGSSAMAEFLIWSQIVRYFTIDLGWTTDSLFGMPLANVVYILIGFAGLFTMDEAGARLRYESTMVEDAEDGSAGGGQDEGAATDASSPEEGADRPTVTTELVAQVVSEATGVPVSQLTEGETERLLTMEDALRRRVVGQDEAVSAVSKTVRRVRAGLGNPRRPGGSFLFLGPTGVGKTELAKALAEFLFGTEDALITFDMRTGSCERARSMKPGYQSEPETLATRANAPVAKGDQTARSPASE